MKVAFDTNVILDFILHRPNAQAALELVRKVAAEEIGGIISANSITDIYYIARKTIGDEKLVRRSLTFWLSLTWHPLMVMVAVRRWQPP